MGASGLAATGGITALNKVRQRNGEEEIKTVDTHTDFITNEASQPPQDNTSCISDDLGWYTFSPQNLHETSINEHGLNSGCDILSSLNNIMDASSSALQNIFDGGLMDVFSMHVLNTGSMSAAYGQELSLIHISEPTRPY